ncbi:uncharacterized protein B0H18DRAFT_980193 [Fomitopsis serialis]|uniref:uncharacterized protein n=1 Tax=Fomitopsis serialis TaxID=139415 RepID=UPI0020076025|nr:uncharacterized protein B0H18DRAFT_1054261 [Neoantrodia serialis]XP_047898307.1 uncharacterized protein B0H18DRAFT_980193 [Neoantrodia serialis]KAH9912383.1 hypothetical protein B0H18DRAFT_1054261 [Neoantrodia serialis]KAH9934241.1 hypothetical protein B0H18DRAFT_980193 [Neoantrodia serialis]
MLDLISAPSRLWLSDGAIFMTLSVDRVLLSTSPDSWDLAEIFSYATAFGKAPTTNSA